MRRLLFCPKKLLQCALQRYPRYAVLPYALISIRQQALYLFRNAHLITTFPVSTSRYGVGSRPHSFRTPSGLHRVYKKIGNSSPQFMRFVGRNEQHKAQLNPLPTISYEDAICTRILWLERLPFNRHWRKLLDSKKRYIYIHGTIDEKRIGRVASRGCIRMRNDDVCKAFSILQEQSLIYIIP
ncbi:MAG: L,D-transpeptidase family protein [Candidatus Oxydemutatoraceae bacterium WSBS_2016_MAG_OTU14]